MISTTPSAGCSIANAMARAIASGEIAIFSIVPAICGWIDGRATVPDSSTKQIRKDLPMLRGLGVLRQSGLPVASRPPVPNPVNVLERRF